MQTKLRSATAGACVVLAAVALGLGGCAEKGSPVEPDGSSGYRIVGSLAIAGDAEHVEVAGDLCVLAASQGGLVLVDVSDPSEPTYLGMGATAFESTGCAYIQSDSIAFVTNGTSGIMAFDVSNPASPVQIGNGQLQQSRDVVAVEVTPGELHHLFVADGLGGFHTLEFRYYPSFHQWFFSGLDQSGSFGSARGVYVEGDLALVAMEQLGVWTYDVSAPSEIVPLGTIDTPGEARAVTSAEGYAYVADWRDGLQVLDISDPSVPVIVASARTDGRASGIDYRDGLVYVADHVGGLRVFDVSDPVNPQDAGHVDTPFANGVFVTDSYIFIADRDWGLVIAEAE